MKREKRLPFYEEASLLRRGRGKLHFYEEGGRGLEHGFRVLLPSRRRARGRSSKKMSMLRASLSLFPKEGKRALYIRILELA